MEADATTGTSELVAEENRRAADATRRWLSPALFACAVLAFLLPFATVSCDSARTSFTGIQLVTRSVPKGGAVHEGPDCSADLSRCVERQASTTAAIALAVALIGLTLGLFRIQRGPGWCAAIGVGAIVALPLESLLADVRLHWGWRFALLFFSWAGVLHAKRALCRRGDRREAAQTRFS
jgi:hypothetical protein